MVERRVVSLRSSTEDLSIPALCEVGRGHPWLRCYPFRFNELDLLQYFHDANEDKKNKFFIGLSGGKSSCYSS